MSMAPYLNAVAVSPLFFVVVLVLGAVCFVGCVRQFVRFANVYADEGWFFARRHLCLSVLLAWLFLLCFFYAMG